MSRSSWIILIQDHSCKIHCLSAGLRYLHPASIPLQKNHNYLQEACLLICQIFNLTTIHSLITLTHTHTSIYICIIYIYIYIYIFSLLLTKVDSWLFFVKINLELLVESFRFGKMFFERSGSKPFSPPLFHSIFFTIFQDGS